MMRSPFIALVLAVAGCSAGHDAPDTRTAAIVTHTPAYRGPAVVTGQGDLAACPRKSDLEQYGNDMANLKVDPGDPGYEVARAYDLRNRGCMELKKGEHVQIQGGDHVAEIRVQPFGQMQTYWTTADWTRAEATGEPAENVNEMRRSHR